MSIDEKRNTERYGFKETIQYAFLSSDRFFSAKTVNSSKDGLCFRSGYNIRPKAHIFLTIEDSDRVHDSKEFADGSFCQSHMVPKSAEKACVLLPDRRSI